MHTHIYKETKGHKATLPIYESLAAVGMKI